MPPFSVSSRVASFIANTDTNSLSLLFAAHLAEDNHASSILAQSLLSAKKFLHGTSATDATDALYRSFSVFSSQDNPQVAAVLKDKFISLSFLKLETLKSTDTKAAVGTMSDSIQHITPCAVPPNFALSHFVGLVPRKIAVDFDLSFSPTDISALVGDDNNAPDVFAEIGFTPDPNDDDGSSLVLAALPTVMPLIRGTCKPHSSAVPADDLDAVLPMLIPEGFEDRPASAYPEGNKIVIAWFKSTSHIYKFNQGVSLKIGDSFQLSDSIEISNSDIDYSFIEGLTMVDSPELPSDDTYGYGIIQYDSPDMSCALDRIQEDIIKELEYQQVSYSGQSSVDQPPLDGRDASASARPAGRNIAPSANAQNQQQQQQSSTNPNPTNNNVLAQLAHALLQANGQTNASSSVNSATTASDETVKSFAAAHYEVLAAYLDDSVSPPVARPGKLRTPFTTFLKKKGSGESRQELALGIKMSQETVRRPERIQDSNIAIHALGADELAYDAFSTNLRLARWDTCAPADASAAPVGICFGSFGTSFGRAAAADRQRREEIALQAESQRALGVHASLVVQESTTLIRPDPNPPIESVYKKAGNFTVFLEYMFENIYELGRMPVIVIAIHKLSRVLMHMDGRKYLYTMVERDPSLTNHIVDMFNVIVYRMVNIAQEAAVSRTADGVTIRAEGLQSLLDFAETSSSQLYHAIQVKTWPMGFIPKRALEYGGSTPVRERPSQQQRTEQPRRDNSARDNSQVFNENPSYIGLVQSKFGDGSIPRSIRPAFPTGILMPARGGGQPTQICSKYILRGRGCNNPSCPRFHLNNVNDLSREHRQVFDRWADEQQLVLTEAARPHRNGSNRNTSVRSRRGGTSSSAIEFSFGASARWRLSANATASSSTSTEPAVPIVVPAQSRPVITEASRPTPSPLHSIPLRWEEATDVAQLVSAMMGAPPPANSNTERAQVPLPPAIIEDDEPSAVLITPSPESRRIQRLHPNQQPTPDIPTLRSRTQKASFVATCPTTVQTILDQPFGKPDLNHSFTNQVSLRLVLLPLFKSGLLTKTDLRVLSSSFAFVPILLDLLAEYSHLDFTSLRTSFFAPDWQKETDINQERGRLFTACLLHFNGDMSSVVRYVGGPLTAGYRDVPRILSDIKPIVDDTTFRNVEKVLTIGAPTRCVATSTDRNLATYLAYGNHASAYQDMEKTLKGIVKDARCGYITFCDIRMSLFTLNLHICPLGVAAVNHPYKKPRPVFDASMHVKFDSMTINDWITNDTEPPMHFGTALERLLQWIWALRISFPEEEIYLGDDDVQGCFRRIANHPDLVSMQSFVFGHYLLSYPRQSFGVKSCPPNWEPVSDARQQVASHFWTKPDDTQARAAPYLPPLTLTAPPTAEEVSNFVRANADSQNLGALSASGQRIPPPFPMYVDDELFADIRSTFKVAVAAAVLSLYTLVGFPQPHIEPDAMSWIKFSAQYGHKRQMIGLQICTRSLQISMLPQKREMLLALLATWAVPGARFSLIEFATLAGTLQDHAKSCLWASLFVTCVTAQLQSILQVQYIILRRNGALERIKSNINRMLPRSVADRLQSLVSKQVATVLWHSRKTFPPDSSVRTDLQTLRHYLSDPTNPWQKSIGHMIPRDVFGCSYGDASTSGGLGFVSHTHHFWSMLIYSTELQARLRLGRRQRGRISINQLEMVTQLLQLIAIGVAIEDPSVFPAPIAAILRSAPTAPQWRIMVDNTTAESWAKNLMARTSAGRRLVRLQSLLYKRFDIQLRPEWLSSHDNDLADLISHMPLGQTDEIISLFPTESAAYFIAPVHNALRAGCGSPQSAKQRGTLRTRRIYYCQWARAVGLGDDLLLDGPHITQERRLWQFVLFATHLMSGSNFFNKRVTSQTIKGYLLAAASMVALASGFDPRKSDPTSTSLFPILANLLAEYEKWEALPNRAEPFTVQMQEVLDSEIASHDHGPDSIQQATADWTALGLRVGYRISEYAQTEDAQRTVGEHARDPLYTEDCVAFGIEDVTFTLNKKTVLMSAIVHAPSVTAAWNLCDNAQLRFGIQKNGDRNQKLDYAKSSGRKLYCAVFRLVCIVRRFHRLVGIDTHKVPISVYLSTSGDVYNIVRKDMNNTVKFAAIRAYQLDPIADKKFIEAFRSHSIRVGACNILYGNGVAVTIIKARLRWKSEAFMVYFRNIGAVSHVQSLAIEEAIQHPELF